MHHCAAAATQSLAEDARAARAAGHIKDSSTAQRAWRGLAGLPTPQPVMNFRLRLAAGREAGEAIAKQAVNLPFLRARKSGNFLVCVGRLGWRNLNGKQTPFLRGQYKRPCLARPVGLLAPPGAAWPQGQQATPRHAPPRRYGASVAEGCRALLLVAIMEFLIRLIELEIRSATLRAAPCAAAGSQGRAGRAGRRRRPRRSDGTRDTLGQPPPPGELACRIAVVSSPAF